jgi:hypothetical protein
MIPAAHAEQLREGWKLDEGLWRCFGTRGGRLSQPNFTAAHRQNDLYPCPAMACRQGRSSCRRTQKFKLSAEGRESFCGTVGDGITISVLPIDQGLLDTVVVELDKAVTGLMAVKKRKGKKRNIF